MPTSAAYEQACQLAGAIFGWRLDEGTGPAASDHLDGRPGVYAGAFALGVAGPFSDRTAVHLTGGRVGWTPSWLNFNVAAISTWIKADTLTPAADGIIFEQGAPAHGFNLEQLAGSGSFFIGQPGVGGVAAGFAIPDLAWHHLVLQGLAGGGIGYEFYFDGALRFIASVAANTPDPSTFNIGSFGTGATPWAGSAAEVFAFQRVLGAEDVSSIYQSGASGSLTGSLAVLNSAGTLAEILAAVKKVY